MSLNYLLVDSVLITFSFFSYKIRSPVYLKKKKKVSDSPGAGYREGTRQGR